MSDIKYKTYTSNGTSTCLLPAGVTISGRWTIDVLLKKIGRLSNDVGAQQRRDNIKDEICKERDITLLRISYSVKNKREYIKNFLDKLQKRE